MTQLKRVIYFPTLRCNCACKHCGQSRYFQEAECDCSLIRERLLESSCQLDVFSITGGEPFLKDGLPDELARIVNEVGCYTDITTNGTCVEAVRAFADQVKDPSKLLVSVSIDGMPQVHNRIRRNQDAFDRAVETAKLLRERHVPVKINTVIQRDNCHELDSFADYMRERVGGDVVISWIPLLSELNGESAFPYDEEETAIVLSRVDSAQDRAYLLSAGTVKMKNCHAGQRTMVISPSGKVYACLTSFAYKDVARRESFLIGDLKTQTLDEIANTMADPQAGYRAAVRGCEGCWSACEVMHETEYWGMRIEGTQILRGQDEEAKPEAAEAAKEETEGKLPVEQSGPPGRIPQGLEKGATPDMSEESEATVNVEEIMAEIRRNVQMDEELRDLPRFEDIPIRSEQPAAGASQEERINWPELQEALHYVNTHYDIPYYWSFGPDGIKTFMKRVVRRLVKCILSPILAAQNMMNCFFVRCANNLRHGVRELFERADAQQQRIERLESALGAAQQRIDDLQRTQNALCGKINALSEKADALDRQSDAFSASAAKAILAYKRREGIPDSERAVIPAKPPEEGGDPYRELDYFKFQNDFRGTRSTIMERQQIYLPYFQGAAAPVLDIGCGRGEFLRLMKDHAIPAFGVDLYPEYAVEGELQGLDIRQGDGIAFLREADSAFGGIFACQVIEHISFEQLQELCAAAYEKLLPGAYLVLETPNPRCVSMFTSSFYVDPTHNKPVHPLLLEYLLREVGFSEIKTVYTAASKVNFSLPKIQSDGIRNLEEVNAAIERVSEFLYGSLDYAVIARK